MSRISVAGVIRGGLVAGLVANVCDFVLSGVLLAGDMDLMRQRLGINPAQMFSTSVTITWVVVDFILGFLIVWTYAAVRPRLGAGPKTAIIASVVIYLGITMVLYGFTRMGLFTTTLWMKGALLSLIAFVLAALAGAATYTEET
jgi:hypothetical protein